MEMDIFRKNVLFTGQICPELQKQEIQLMEYAAEFNSKGIRSKTIFSTISSLKDLEGKDPKIQESLKRIDDFIYLFSEFLEQEFSLTYEGLIPTIEYVAPYVGGVKYSYGKPTAFSFPKVELVRKYIDLTIYSEIKSLFIYNNYSNSSINLWRKIQMNL